jgi:uncharacterized protein YggE
MTWKRPRRDRGGTGAFRVQGRAYDHAMQVIGQPWGIAVQASAMVTAAPELARVRFRISRLEQSPADAFASVTAIVERVRQTLRTHGVAEVKESRLDLRAVWSYGEPTPTLAGYQCQAAFAVTTAELDGVPRLLADIVAAGASEIDSLEFDVDNRDDLQADAERRAVAAARAKAARYAEAAGVRLGAVLHIEDAAEASHPYQLAAASREAGPGDSLAPGEITVSAIVRVGFALTRD